MLQAVGAAHNKSSAKVALQWVRSLGFALATAPWTEEHMKDDLDIFDWQMTADEVAQVSAVGSIAPDDPVKQMCLFK